MNKPAFPTFKGLDNIQTDGMSLRDYFAAHAMIAFIDKDEWQSTIGDVAREVAFHAYAIADAMLEERKK